MLPTSVRLIESFEKHEHNFCTESSLHFHQQIDDCVTCDFSFSNFKFELDQKYYVFVNFFIYSNSTILEEILYVSNITSFDLRGPPFNV